MYVTHASMMRQLLGVGVQGNKQASLHKHAAVVCIPGNGTTGIINHVQLALQPVHRAGSKSKHASSMQQLQSQATVASCCLLSGRPAAVTQHKQSADPHGVILPVADCADPSCRRMTRRLMSRPASLSSTSACVTRQQSTQKREWQQLCGTALGEQVL